MSEKNYQSPDGPGLNLDDFHPASDLREGYSPQPNRTGGKFKADAAHQQQRLSGGIVGHQQYGTWQEHNQLYQQAPKMAGQQFYPPGAEMMHH